MRGGLGVERSRCALSVPQHICYADESPDLQFRLGFEPLFEIPACSCQPPQPFREVNQAMRNQIPYLSLALPDPVHPQQPCCQKLLALALPNPLPDDDLDRPALRRSQWRRTRRPSRLIGDQAHNLTIPPQQAAELHGHVRLRATAPVPRRCTQHRLERAATRPHQTERPRCTSLQ